MALLCRTRSLQQESLTPATSKKFTAGVITCGVKLSFDLVLLTSGLCLSFPFSASRCKEREASAVAQLEPCPPPWHCPPIKVLVGATSCPPAQTSSRERCLREVCGKTALLNKLWSSSLRWCWFGVKFSD